MIVSEQADGHLQRKTERDLALRGRVPRSDLILMSATRGTALPLLVLLLAQGATSLHIVFGAHNIPHPAKASTGGEDAFFFDDRLAFLESGRASGAA